MSFPLVGSPQRLAVARIFQKNQKDCGQAAMTESDNDVALLMNELVICRYLDFYVDRGNHFLIY